MRYGSVCSGIEAASVAWNPLGWSAAWLAEIEKFPSQVLEHHHPDVPNLGDMTRIVSYLKSGMLEAPDVFVGGTPCQAFSVAGLRNSLEDDRGQLTLTYIHILDAIDEARRAAGQRPAIALWENVPGVLNTHDNAFGCLLSGLAGLDEVLRSADGKWRGSGMVVGRRRRVAWVTLDAQYFGVPQRRRRIFVLAVDAQSVADSPALHPSKILSIGASLRRDTPSRSSQRQSITHPVAPSLTSSCRGVERAGETRGQDLVVAEGFHTTGAGYWREGSGTLRAREQDSHENLVTIMAHGQANAEIRSDGDPPSLTCDHEAPIVVHGTRDPCVSDIAFAQGRNNGCENVVSYRATGRRSYYEDDKAEALRSVMAKQTDVDLVVGMQVRRLTPEECEILQGFPVGYTNIPGRKEQKKRCEEGVAVQDDDRVWHYFKPTPDGPRYKTLGNSMAVPVMRWIGARIQEALNE